MFFNVTIQGGMWLTKWIIMYPKSSTHSSLYISCYSCSYLLTLLRYCVLLPPQNAPISHFDFFYSKKHKNHKILSKLHFFGKNKMRFLHSMNILIHFSLKTYLAWKKEYIINSKLQWQTFIHIKSYSPCRAAI